MNDQALELLEQIHSARPKPRFHQSWARDTTVLRYGCGDERAAVLVGSDRSIEKCELGSRQTKLTKATVKSFVNGARADAPFEVISGYRSPQTNAALHERSSGVASQSLHMQGMAMDVRLPGRALAKLHDAALALGQGGVGFYPTSDFVHVDVGRVRRWNGV